jgi:hypothetical protein
MSNSSVAMQKEMNDATFSVLLHNGEFCSGFLSAYKLVLHK